METRKSEKADLENKKSVFLLTGLVIACTLILTAFEVKFKPSVSSFAGTLNTVPEEEEFTPVPVDVLPVFMPSGGLASARHASAKPEIRYLFPEGKAALRKFNSGLTGHEND